MRPTGEYIGSVGEYPLILKKIGVGVMKINPGARSTEDLVTEKKIEPILFNK
jgi:hypothetical protein